MSIHDEIQATLNRDNLAKLATYLESLPLDYSDFNMKYFFFANGVPDHRAIEERYALENGGVGACGAVACAVGHGPSAGILFEPDLITLGYPAWDSYIARNFIAGDRRGSSATSLAFDWMFGSKWAWVDNTPHGAAKRIRYLLEGHEIPLTYENERDIQRASVAFYQSIGVQS